MLRLDHSMIVAVIAGTSTPLRIALRGALLALLALLAQIAFATSETGSSRGI
jgi:predicted membrane channel-forming protein YqfA (hemolysin III family)